MSKIDWEYTEQQPIEDWRDYYTVTCPICGCGSDEIRDLLHECLKWAASGDEQHKKDGSEWDKGFYRSIQHELAAHILVSVGLLDHGSGIGWAWASEDGKRLLALVEKMKVS